MVCVFKDCKSKQRKDNILGISFFRFPRNKERCEIWRQICNNDTINGLTWDELRNRFVCEIHFKKDDLEHYQLPSGVKRKLLRKTALPICQNECESDKQSFLKKNSSVEHKDEPSEVLGCLERSSVKRKLIDNDSDDISTPKAICKFIEKASGALIDHLDHLLTDPLDKKEDHSYCRVIMGKLDHSDSNCHQALSHSVSDCPPIRPISPPSSDPDDTDHVSTISKQVAGKMGSRYTPSATPGLGKGALLGSYGTISTNIIAQNIAPCDWTTSTLPLNKHPGPKRYKKILPKRDIKSEVLSHGWGDIFNESDLEEVVLNLAGQGLEKLERLEAGPISSLVTTLILDNNSFHVLPTINLYDQLTKVSLVNNQIDSLIWFRRLVSLRELDLSHNRLVDMNGLGRLERLTRLNLSSNRIKVLKWRSGEPSSSVPPLEFIDLSANRVALLRDISSLTNLRELLLHQNELKSLCPCEKFLPRSLYRLTLSENRVSNLCDVSALSPLRHLRHLSVARNPCMAPRHFGGGKNEPSGGRSGPYDYRPYVLTKCPGLESLDDLRITEDERAKANSLLREGRIHEEGAGNHTALVAFLSEMCPLETRDGPSEQQGPEPPEPDKPSSIPSIGKNQCMEEAIPQEAPSMASEDPNSPSRLRGTPNIPSKAIRTKKQTPLVEKGERASTQAVPCEHLIAVIEEKARNHGLKRANERLEDVLHQLQQRLLVLEARAALRSESLPTPLEFGLQLEIKEEQE